MTIIDLFSKRQKRQRGDVPDIYTYDEIPQKLRVQIVQIIRDAIGANDQVSLMIAQLYENLHNVLCREYGIFSLTNNPYHTNQEKMSNFLLHTNKTEEVIDVIELSFKCIAKIIKPNYQLYHPYIKISPDDAISELNERFKENGIGYSFDGNQIIRIDSTYIHSEVTKPVICLLSNKKFEGPNEEYLKAHDHYRLGRNKECLVECLKAFESTIKVICKEKGWKFTQKNTASRLIQICFENELIPHFSQNQFTSLQSLLESGIPTIRNKLGAHGQGQTPQTVDNEITRYCLNLTGSNIIFLVEQSGLK